MATMAGDSSVQIMGLLAYSYLIPMGQYRFAGVPVTHSIYHHSAGSSFGLLTQVHHNKSINRTAKSAAAYFL